MTIKWTIQEAQESDLNLAEEIKNDPDLTPEEKEAHSECWRPWYESRHKRAVEALAALGLHANHKEQKAC
jgi:hypothetical protein